MIVGGSATEGAIPPPGIALAMARAAFAAGHFHEARERLTALLRQIDDGPEGDEAGPDSITRALAWLGRLLERDAHLDEALERLGQAYTLVASWRERYPGDAELVGLHGDLAGELGDVFAAKGDSAAALQLYRDSLQVAEWRGDLRGRVLTLERYGRLLLHQADYETAESLYGTVADLYAALGEPEGVAVARHELGRIAQARDQVSRAEDCYRASMALWEHRDRPVEAASSSNQLAILAEQAGRFDEADAWYRQAIALAERVGPGHDLARYLENYAAFLDGRAAADGPHAGCWRGRALEMAARASSAGRAGPRTAEAPLT
jgi:tetratricopeptide (TPR) repeat protein